MTNPLENQATPRCELCGCTEMQSCPGGCTWSLDHLEQGHRVCTQCAPGFFGLILPGDPEYAETLAAMRHG